MYMVAAVYTVAAVFTAAAVFTSAAAFTAVAVMHACVRNVHVKNKNISLDNSDLKIWTFQVRISSL